MIACEAVGPELSTVAHCLAPEQIDGAAVLAGGWAVWRHGTDYIGRPAV